MTSDSYIQRGRTIVDHIMLILRTYRSKISTFIDDNKALLRRMYGTLVKNEDIPEQPKTPASTTLFFRTVRNFAGKKGYMHGNCKKMFEVVSK